MKTIVTICIAVCMTLFPRFAQADQDPHAVSLEEARKELAVLKAERSVYDEKPAWFDVIEKGSGPTEQACRAYTRFREGHDLKFRLYEDVELLRISFDELEGISEEKFDNLYKEAGLTAAKQFLSMLQTPPPGPKVLCGRGEGSFYLTETGRLLEELIWVLTELKAEPKDIDSSPEDLRKFQIKALKEEIEASKDRILSSADARGSYSGLLAEHNLTPEELELSEDLKRALAETP